MWSAFIYVKNLAGLAIFMFLLCFGHCFHVNPIPCNVSLSESCHALLYYVPKSPRTLEETTSLFHVNSNSVNRTVNGYAIAIECSCPAGHSEFTWHADYTIQHGDTWESINEKFGSFVVKKNDRTLIESLTITLDLLCGCSKGVEVLSYRVESGDTLFTICSRFNTSVEKTKELNKLDNPRLIHAGDVIFIPKPGGLKYLLLIDYKELKVKRRSKSCLLIVGIFVAAVTTAILLAIIVLWRTSLKIGQGSCGSVYLGNLRGNDVAIKQMKNTKSKEFLSEINILCRVQHTNSIKLIGYTGGGDSLFLVYEFAKNGALSSHLHNPTERGYKPLTWIMQVQIALDAAKGLEYIHLNTKPSFIHRDVKSSNILLDSGFHAKIADFGLVKLSEHSPDNGTTASRIVGTFGYLAPEYARDGCVTTKIDVYAFGVVLMELLTGLPALRRDASTGSMQYVERCSLMDYVLSVLENGDAFTKLSQSIDPTLTQYHRGSLLQMALLSKDCVNADWNQRPDMSNVVLRLEHALVCSKEWEKAEPSSSEW
ncbi:lysM domain receptor-like kinase 3 isoform X3 [Diospyros lotus]|uniref:lysM domain receptor-like kinase 3 isoform X3 n=1 Tax=Diospyros lotus TaxID=55363 RepID=UPI002258C92B|nr:lysM domain receptor-like kinase 3 isoform X3 [Diospyros lotus]